MGEVRCFEKIFWHFSEHVIRVSLVIWTVIAFDTCVTFDLPISLDSG
jgi:hypothetical protein